jgi:hypothetical protein
LFVAVLHGSRTPTTQPEFTRRLAPGSFVILSG